MARRRAGHSAGDEPFFGRVVVALAVGSVLLLPGAAAAQGTWTATSLTNAPAARIAPAVWTGSKVIVWGGWAWGFLNTGGVYDPVTDAWTATSMTNAPTSRSDHTLVWTGSRMIVWGGSQGGVYLNTGGIYDPGTGGWTPTSTTNAPLGRFGHVAVWTGTKMIVWGGGRGAVGYTNTGGIYDPATDTWTTTSTANAPTGRLYHTVVWTGSRMIVWGGQQTGTYDYVNTGGVYDPATDAWTPTRTSAAPAARSGHTAVWTGSKMIVWGGWDGIPSDPYFDTGGLYDPATDAWTATGTTGAPAGRGGHTAVWTGSSMVVWGGDTSTGGLYDPATDAWTATGTAGAPTARSQHAAVWTGSSMIVWGGYSGSVLNTGGVYGNPAPLPLATDFHTVTPCRVVDTRQVATGGPGLTAGSTRGFLATGGSCSIPSTATAVSANLTAVEAAANGNLALFPGDYVFSPSASTLNFTAGVTRANNAVVPLATDGTGTIKVRNRSAAAVHLVLDVNGYFQ